MSGHSQDNLPLSVNDTPLYSQTFKIFNTESLLKNYKIKNYNPLNSSDICFITDSRLIYAGSIQLYLITTHN